MDTSEIHVVSSEVTNFEDEEEDICNLILSKFSSSTKEDHQHLCAVVGATAQELKDQKIPLSAISFFGETISSLDRLAADPKLSDPVIPALLTSLSMILPKVSTPFLKMNINFVSELILRILRTESMSYAAVIPGLKCVSHVLVVGDKVNWLDVSQLFVVLLGFITDCRPKVRKQSHLCLRDVLQSFQRSAILVPASEGITTILQRFLLLAGGPNTTDSGRRRGVEEVLFILDALKDCLPLMSSNAITSMLKYFESLLKFKRPFGTRHISDSLHVLCLNLTSEVTPKILGDLLCSLAESASQNERSVNTLTSTARLLDVGIRKVYSLNRDICVARLPIVFHALGEILSCEHEEAVLAATEAFRGLIFTCIDGGLIKQEFEHIRDNDDEDCRHSGTTIEKICATVESLLEYRYNAVWDMSLKVVSTMFDKLGEFSYQLLRGAFKSLENMQKMTDEALQCRIQANQLESRQRLGKRYTRRDKSCILMLTEAVLLNRVQIANHKI